MLVLADIKIRLASYGPVRITAGVDVVPNLRTEYIAAFVVLKIYVRGECLKHLRESVKGHRVELL